MSLPVPTILVYFGLEYSGSGYAIYNDPVKGIYDDATYLYADAAGDGVDVASDGCAVSIRRGRSRELDEFETGTATVTLYNFARTYDNLNAAGLYFGDVVPGKRVEISLWGQMIFAGTIEDWNMEWDVSGSATASFLAVDALGRLARQEFDAWTTTAAQTSGPRLNMVLDRNEVLFPASARDIDTGTSSLQSENVTWGSNVLNYAQLVNRSEAGRFFASRSGLLTHRDRYSLVGVTPMATFADTGAVGTIPFAGVTTDTGSEFLYNRVGIDRETGTLQTVEDPVSEAAYGIRTLTYSGLLMDTDGQSEDMAEYLLGIYKDPLTRVSSITVLAAGLSGTAAGTVAALEIGDMVEVLWTPLGVGSQVDQQLVVEGVDHDVSPSEHIVTIHTSPVSQVAVAIYDDPARGIYDTPLAVYGF